MKLDFLMNENNKPPWNKRRQMMWAAFAFFVLVILWCLWQDSDTEVAQNAVTMAFTGIISVVGSYVFGAVWDDKG